jgi:hypothetical protein
MTGPAPQAMTERGRVRSPLTAASIVSAKPGKSCVFKEATCTVGAAIVSRKPNRAFVPPTSQTSVGNGKLTARSFRPNSDCTPGRAKVNATMGGSFATEA